MVVKKRLGGFRGTSNDPGRESTVKRRIQPAPELSLVDSYDSLFDKPCLKEKRVGKGSESEKTGRQDR